MVAVGMLMLGAFMGYVIAYGLRQVTEWNKPANVFAAVTSAALSGAVLAFMQFAGGEKLGQGLFFYPVGLGYGALLPHLEWLTKGEKITGLGWLHIVAVAVATILLLMLLLWPWFRTLFPA